MAGKSKPGRKHHSPRPGSDLPVREALWSATRSTLKRNGHFEKAPAAIPTLTFLSGDALGKEIPLVQPRVALGRGEQNDIRIIDPSISRNHLMLSCRAPAGKGRERRPRVLLQDLGSKNGTAVNYRRVRRAVLRPGDKILVGQVLLRFEYRDVADQSFYEQLNRLANIDHLSDLYNKGAITRFLHDEIGKVQRYHTRLSVLMIDMDHFKNINDTYGHATGDRVIRCAADILKRTLREQDRAGRFGGEEFVVVLPETGIQGAARVAERIRSAFGSTISKLLGLRKAVTASFGVASVEQDPAQAPEILQLADAVLYQAKARGRNRVELWHGSPSTCARPRD